MRAVNAAVVIVLLGLFASVVFAETGQVPAVIAMAKVHPPTFRELHERYMCTSLNESGWKNLADQGGILESMLFGSGGREGEGRGTGYGINYSRMMMRLVTHSPRTFPIESRFLLMLSPEKAQRSKRLRTYNNDWTSTLTLDCSQPALWDEGRSGQWNGYKDRCVALRESTKAFLQGRVRTTCNGQPTTWGSEEDAHRKGGPIESGWQEISCDRQVGPIHVGSRVIKDCQQLREMALDDDEVKKYLINNSDCSVNRFWNWKNVTRERQVAMR